MKFRYLLGGLCAVGDGGDDDVGEDDDDDDEDKDTDDADDEDKDTDEAEFKVGRGKLSCLTRSRKARLASCLAALSCKYLYDGRPNGASGE